MHCRNSPYPGIMLFTSGVGYRWCFLSRNLSIELQDMDVDGQDSQRIQ
jgi:hypothetical protein